LIPVNPKDVQEVHALRDEFKASQKETQVSEVLQFQGCRVVT
jgi:hypothetical protein